MMSMSLPMPSYTARMDDLASRLIASKSTPLTISVAWCTMLSSLILKKWTKKEKKKGALKWGHFARTLALHYQVFMLLVGMRANKLDIEKSKWGHDPKWSSSHHVTYGRASSQVGHWKEQVRGHDPKWSSSLHVTYGLVSSQAGPWKEPVGRHDHKWSSSLHVTCERASAQVGRLKEPKGGHDPKWPSCLHITYGRAGSQAKPWKEPMGVHNPKWPLSIHVTYGC